MATRKYTVTIGGQDDYNDRDAIISALGSSLPFSLYVVGVERYVPPPAGPYRKITAIKELRSLLQCSLADAKFLADTAEKLGEAKWSGVTVTNSEDNFYIADNR